MFEAGPLLKNGVRSQNLKRRHRPHLVGTASLRGGCMPELVQVWRCTRNPQDDRGSSYSCEMHAFHHRLSRDWGLVVGGQRSSEVRVGAAALKDVDDAVFWEPHLRCEHLQNLSPESGRGGEGRPGACQAPVVCAETSFIKPG
ncbi:hypothetical protein SKAU_G00163130 [Synaphobranchus kaupii]|uniref:Uncharacterized protein n=1 Tax=Synaphobranchus kaupii TaxID=118154 RepID=A0A9Q1FJ34_SYNKA|nr:hypothetical protein SKAU_G00163130 [Synaphobranchus kaupii]